MLGEQPHTLRHWERSFGCPRPLRGPSGERLYSEEDIAVLRRIQHLLRVDRYTLPQAQRLFGADSQSQLRQLPPEAVKALSDVLQIALLLLEPREAAPKA